VSEEGSWSVCGRDPGPVADSVVEPPEPGEVDGGTVEGGRVVVTGRVVVLTGRVVGGSDVVGVAERDAVRVWALAFDPCWDGEGP
jgi:hypothetical protein